MRVGRLIGTAASVVAVAASAAVVAGMARAASDDQRQHRVTDARPLASQTRSIPAQLPLTTAPIRYAPAADPSTPAPTRTSPAPSPSPSSTPPSSAPPTATSAADPAPSTSRPSRRAVSPPPASPSSTYLSPAPTTFTPPPKVVTAHAVAHPALQRGRALPVRLATGSATQVVTVTAPARYDTVATLQAWRTAPGGGWLRTGPAILAHLGSQGMTTAPSESKSATPMGSFSLTRAFGHYANPGTSLPYTHTNDSYWWISQAGPLYNTMQSCWSGCPFNTRLPPQPNPNEHLYEETPFYNYAVVIDYNTRNAGTVRKGAGSAFFLHVTVGQPTEGCVSIPQANLLTIMRWLSPSAHPRILIGVS